MIEKKDNVYADKMLSVSPFEFDGSVAQVFSDMAKRSIPGYESVIHQIGVFAKKYITEGSNIYDLGCSLGQATLKVRHSVAKPDCKIIAVDSSVEMVKRLNKILERDIGVVEVDVRCEDVLETTLENASFVILNYTLQFVDFNYKNRLIKKIYDSLNKGGVLLLSEKIVFPDIEKQDYIENLYFDFKRFNGYNELEISQKRDALENVLKLDTSDEHIKRIQSAGFSSVNQWFSYLNFASFIGVK
ncbi:MAG: carboxy-S-adenosyl-L-methionine synthase CmoA [Deltaproteobacteria bacterium]|nr:carboxy-S-adenosyl-L-methionine synthase CmoA [Deltaproteobacteria bacterium]